MSRTDDRIEGEDALLDEKRPTMHPIPATAPFSTGPPLEAIELADDAIGARAAQRSPGDVTFVGEPHKREPIRRTVVVVGSLVVLAVAPSAALAVRQSSLSRALDGERDRVEALRFRLAASEGEVEDFEGRVSSLLSAKRDLEEQVAAWDGAIDALEREVDACRTVFRKFAELYRDDRVPTRSEDAAATTNLVKCFGGSFRSSKAVNSDRAAIDRRRRRSCMPTETERMSARCE